MAELKAMEDDWSTRRSGSNTNSCVCVQKIGVKVVPIGFFLVLLFGFITTYVLAVTNDHVRSVFPYISDTGNFHPESSLFTLVCSVGAMLALATFYIHYKHTQLMTEHKWYLRCNTLAFLLSLAVCFGLLLIAAFQDGEALSTIHYVGAALMFGVGTIYCCITTWVGWHIAKVHSDQWLIIITGIRIGMCLLMVAGVVTVFTATYIADSRYEKLSANNTFSKFKWNPNDEAFEVHMVATVSEWIVASIAILFFLTFLRSFHSIEVETITVKVKEQYGYLRIDEGEFT